MTGATADAVPRDVVAAPEPPSSAAEAGERALRVVVLVWSAAWIVLMWIQGVGASLAPALSTALLAGLTVGWFVVVLARLPVGGAYAVVLAATALAQAALTPPVGLWTQSGLLITWTNLAAIVCGLLVAGPRGRIGITLIAAGQLAILSTRAAVEGNLAMAFPGIVAAAAYALADGMAAHVAASAVRTQARDTDAASDLLAHERTRTAVRAAQDRDAERVSRVLHDTVLNTLGALRRGVDAQDVDAVRSRCAHDLEELRRLRDTRFETIGDTGIEVDSLLRALTARAAVLSLELEVDSRVTSTETLPTAVADAVVGACSEALVNVAKHSGVRTAGLGVVWDGVRLELRVQDDGVGWSGEVMPGRGVARSIIGRCADGGADVLVATAPGAGTTVTITWEAPPAEVPAAATTGDEPAQTEVSHLLAQVAVRAGGWLTALLAFLTHVFWGVTDPVSSVVALAILGAVLSLSWWLAVRRGRVPIPTAYAVLLVIAAFLVTMLPARDAVTCDQLVEGWWGLDGAVVVLLSLVLLTRGWWTTVAASLALVLGALVFSTRGVPLPADCATLPLMSAAFELTIVAAIVIFREALLRQWARAADARARSEALRTEADVREATERSRFARVSAVLSATVPLLDSLATGLADPTDADVRRRSAWSESAMRSLLSLGRWDDGLHDLLGEAVLAAYADGRALEVMPTVGQVSLPGEAAVEPLRDLLRHVVDGLPPEGAVTAALIRGPEGCALTLVSDSPIAPLPVETGRRLQEAGLALDQARVGTQSLVEVTWS